LSFRSRSFRLRGNDMIEGVLCFDLVLAGAAIVYFVRTVCS